MNDALYLGLRRISLTPDTYQWTHSNVTLTANDIDWRGTNPQKGAGEICIFSEVASFHVIDEYFLEVEYSLVMGIGRGIQH